MPTRKEGGRGRRPDPRTARQLARVPRAAPLTPLVPQLAPGQLHQIIRRRGLEACGDLVVSATAEQLASILDLDLWRSARASADEGFDADRFGEWVELMADLGEDEALRVLAKLDRDLVVLGLSRYIRVLDPASLAPAASTDDEAMEPPCTFESGVSGEVGGYLVHARRPEAWDAIVTLLVSLAVERPDDFHAIMRDCRRLSDAAPEIDGLDELLSAPEQVEHDAAIAREQRRGEQGYVAPADARAFLQAARTRVPATPDPPAPDGNQAGLPRARRVQGLQVLMGLLRDVDEDAFLARTGELTRLANVVIAGCSRPSGPFTPEEAARAVIATCDLALERSPGGHEGVTFLLDHTLVATFETGWGILHRDVGLVAAGQLIAALATVRPGDSTTRIGLVALRRDLERALDLGMPWRAARALDVIATLDVPAWAGLVGLLEECPVLPAALVALVERRTGAISATAYDFIASRAQIDTVRRFLERLPDLLAG